MITTSNSTEYLQAITSPFVVSHLVSKSKAKGIALNVAWGDVYERQMLYGGDVYTVGSELN